jgi:hypothetical protein
MGRIERDLAEVHKTARGRQSPRFVVSRPLFTDKRTSRRQEETGLEILFEQSLAVVGLGSFDRFDA